MLGIVGADSISARGTVPAAACTGAYRMRPYGCFVREGMLGQSQSQANAGGASNGGDSSQPEDVEFEEVK